MTTRFSNSRINLMRYERNRVTGPSYHPLIGPNFIFYLCYPLGISLSYWQGPRNRCQLYYDIRACRRTQYLLQRSQQSAWGLLPTHHEGHRWPKKRLERLGRRMTLLWRRFGCLTSEWVVGFLGDSNAGGRSSEHLYCGVVWPSGKCFSS